MRDRPFLRRLASCLTTSAAALIVIAIVVLVAGASRAAAQTSADGSIRGYVKDAQSAFLPGVSVTATSVESGRTFIAVSDTKGYYRLQALPPGEYEIAAELEGFAKFLRRGVVVRAGLNLGLEIVMEVGNRAEAIEVKAETPLLENSSASQSVNISGSFQRSLPLSSRRNWADFLTLTPGVTSIQARFQTYNLHGADQDSNVFQMDGADIGSLLQSNSLYAQFNLDAIGDVQVKTAAVDASAPLGLGAVINIAATSGTNTYRGAGSFAYQPKSWNANNNPGGQALTVDVIQPEASFGGPIQRERWWAFGAWRYAHNHTGVSRTPLQVASIKALVPDFELIDNRQQAAYYFGKVTGQLGVNHQLLAFAKYDVNPYGGIQATEAGEFRDIVPGGPVYTTRLSSIWKSSLTTRVMASYNATHYEVRNLNDSVPGRQVHRDAFLSGGRLVGSGTLATLDASTSSGLDVPAYYWTFSADATWFRSGFAGSHELQVGTYLQPKRHNHWQSTYGAGGFRLEEVILADPANPAAGLIPFRRQIYDVDRVSTTYVDAHDYAFYVQDAWRPTTRATITAGLRVDFIKRTDKLFDVVTQDSTEVGPRFGVNYLLTQDGRNAVRASWGRVHENLTTNETTAGTNAAGYRDLYDLDLDGTFETVFVTPGRTVRAADKIIDLDNYHQSHIDEWTVGYRRQLGGQISLDGSFVRRAYRGRPASIESNGIYDNGVFRGFRNEAFNEIYTLTSNTFNAPIYSALQFQVTRQAARFQLIAGYTRQWRHLDGTWQPNDPASFIQPDAFANDKGIGGIIGSTNGGPFSDGSSLSGSSQAGAVQWRDHSALAGLSWQAPWQLQLSANYLFQSGVWSGPIVTRLSAPDPRFGPPTVTLSNGRVASNPLATAIRFANATRGDGQFTLDDVHQLNLRIGREWRFGPRSIAGAVDVINVTNHDADQSINSGANQLYNPNYGSGSSRQFPRAAQISVRVQF